MFTPSGVTQGCGIDLPYSCPSSPAPEPGALRVHTNISPILAQTFTDPFVVFSAKRFPGVPGM